MKAITLFIRFFVYSNIFIACCALALTLETFYLLKLPASLNWFLLLTFLCTLFVYSLHYYSKTHTEGSGRLGWNYENRKLIKSIILLSLFFIAGGVAWHYKAIFFPDGTFSIRNFIWFVIVPFVSLAYSHRLNPWSKKSLRQIGWLKLFSLSFVWSFTTVLLPVIMWTDASKCDPVLISILFIQRFIFMMALCVLFNIKDAEEDKREGIRTYAAIYGPNKILQIGKWLFLILNLVSGYLLLYYFNLSGLYYWIAALIPVLLIFYSFQYFKPSIETAWFVFRYDGLMIVKALLLIFAIIITR